MHYRSHHAKQRNREKKFALYQGERSIFYLESLHSALFFLFSIELSIFASDGENKKNASFNKERDRLCNFSQYSKPRSISLFLFLSLSLHWPDIAYDSWILLIEPCILVAYHYTRSNRADRFVQIVSLRNRDYDGYWAFYGNLDCNYHRKTFAK